jgi:putative ABC transport system permease protein
MTIIDTSTVDVTPARPKRTRPSASLMGGLGLLVRRRLWRDRGLLFSSVLIVALSTFLAYAGPQLVLNTIDAGARDAVTTAGAGADVVVTFPVGNTGGDNLNSVPGTDPEQFTAHAEAVVANLPGALGNLVDRRHAWVLTPQLPITQVVAADDRAVADESHSELEPSRRQGDNIQFGYADGADLTLIDGSMPSDPVADANVLEFSSLQATEEANLPSGSVISSNIDGSFTVLTPLVVDIALTTEVADMLELGIGDVVSIRNPLDVEMQLSIVGLVAPAEPDAAVWDEFPEVTAPTLADNPAMPLFRRGTVMISAPTLATITDHFETPFPGTVYVTIGADGLTLANSPAVGAALDDLTSGPDALLPDETVSISVSSSLGAALDDYPPRARAALAQMSVVVAGVIAVAAVVIALMARLLLSRRESDIALERARGASVPSMALRLFLESLAFTAVGFAAGYMGATLLVGDLALSNATAVVVVIVAVLASPVLGTVLARRTWTGRREAANRQDRAKVRKAQQARRITLEALALVLGGLAVVTLRGRGVLQTHTSGIDPFLAASPVLLALAVTVVVVRLYPVPMAIIQFFAKRTRGVTGVLTLAKARERISVLPLLALTLAIAVAVSGGLLVGTVRNGQEQASWERVGGQVRIAAEVDAVTAASFEHDGLLVSYLYERPETTFALGREYADGRVLGVDDGYAQTVDAAGLSTTDELRALAEASAVRAPGDPIPVLASQEFIDIDFDGRSELYIGRTYIPVTIVGLATVTPDGWSEGPYVIVPLEALQAAESEIPVVPTMTFVTGVGAEEAVESASTIAPQDVTTRSAWLASVRESALIGGVERMMTLAVLAVGVLTAVALLVTVLQGVRARGRALSMLRIQGMGNGYGWWLALTELAPLTVAAVVGGAGAGLLILVLLGGTLGLEVLAGGIQAPPLVVNPEFLSLVGAGVLILLLLAVAAEVITHRRNKLSEVLRFGESR